MVLWWVHFMFRVQEHEISARYWKWINPANLILHIVVNFLFFKNKILQIPLSHYISRKTKRWPCSFISLPKGSTGKSTDLWTLLDGSDLRSPFINSKIASVLSGISIDRHLLPDIRIQILSCWRSKMAVAVCPSNRSLVGSNAPAAYSTK